MDLEQKIANFLAATSAAPARSKLDPYAGLILELRQRRWTFARIAAALQSDFGVNVAVSTLYAFVRVRARRKRLTQLPEPSAPPAGRPAAAQRKPRFNLEA